MKKILGIALLTAFLLPMQHKAFSQNIGTPPLDGVYYKLNSPNREPIPYTSLREADVMWSKRIWRVIDLRQKINLPMYYPTTDQQGRKSLMKIIYDAVKENTITAYTTDNEEFLVPLTPAEIKRSLDKEDTMTMTRLEPPYEQYDSVISNPFSTQDVYLFRVKEDWFFDKQRSVMDVRIIGICPYMEVFDEFGEPKGFKPLFWIYFPECRKLFANNEVYNKWNDAERRTYEDIFFKRLFSSYIYKESNEYDRMIYDYTTPMDGLLEAERIKDELFIKEHDLWEY